MLDRNDRYLFDTSAILIAWQGESGAPDVRDLLQRTVQGACQAYISFMTVFEAYYVTKRRSGPDRAHEIYHFLRKFPFHRIELEEEILLGAGNLKGKYQLSVCDAWIAATARSRGATLVHRDSEFDPVQEVSKLKIGN